MKKGANSGGEIRDFNFHPNSVCLGDKLVGILLELGVRFYVCKLGRTRPFPLVTSSVLYKEPFFFGELPSSVL